SILVPWLVNLAMFNFRAFGWLPSRFHDRRRAYSAESGHIGSQPDATHHNDLSLNFYIPLIVQNRYDFLIELGAFSLDRSRFLASHFPDLRVHALDITQDFQSRRVEDGVHVGPNNLTYIREIAAKNRRGIVVASGTLSYYSFDDLAALFSTLRELKLDLAFNE